MATKEIRQEAKDEFDALTSGKFENFALFSVEVDGEPTEAICAVNHDKEKGMVDVSVLFIRPTEKMKIRDERGQEAKFMNPSADESEMIDWRS